ncbi:MAG TPA: hypothetical protein VN823_08010 [Stellaceae bacterium]|nr:hypothetical protein [Stellaceae bacterium]
MCAAIGFGRPRILAANEVTAYVYPKLGQSEPTVVTFRGGDFAFACGTFIFRGTLGQIALRAFYRAFDGDFALLDDAMSHFAIVVRKNGRVYVSGDRSGIYHVFRDPLSMVISSSFLAVAATLERATLVKQSVFEFVFNGVVSGNDTLFEELSLLPIRSSLVLEHGEAVLVNPCLDPPRELTERSRGELIERSLSELGRYFSAVANLFGDRITCALSGGYDSRLILAMLRHLGAVPRVYVYGRDDEPDVVFASAIARGEGLKLHVVDKDARITAEPDAFPEIVRRNYLASDGYSWSGIFDNGAEHQERKVRVAGGAIALNGGGGEIFRNFFYLPDGRYTFRQFAWSFYAQFDPGTCSDAFDEKEYFWHLERKIYALVGWIGRLDRPTVEWLYHRFRCRSWDGRTDTINSWYGSTDLPFLEPRITDLAAIIPIRWKNHGAFEAELIRIADARLAAYPSVHGYSFATDPPLGARMSDMTTYFRPPWLRRLTHRIKHRRAPSGQFGGYLAVPFVERALPGGVEAMQAYFRINQVADPAQMARILSLEYLARQFGSRLGRDC